VHWSAQGGNPSFPIWAPFTPVPQERTLRQPTAPVDGGFRLAASGREGGADRDIGIKIGAKVVRHGRYTTFQLAEVAAPRQMFEEILGLIARLLAPPAPA